MQLLEKIHPAFLKKFDHFLLTNFPVIWRTRVHYFAFYSLIIGNLLAFAGALAFPVRVNNVLSIHQFDIIYILSLIFMGFVSLIWAFSQIRFRLRSSRTVDLFKTLLLYAFSILCLATNVWTFQHVLILKTANVVSNEELRQDFLTLNASAVLHSYQYEDVYDLSQLDQNAIAPFMRLAAKYGVDKAEIYPDHYSDLGEIRLYSYKLINILASLEAAKYYTGAKSISRSALDFDPDYYYSFHYESHQQVNRLNDHIKSSVLLIAFLPGLLFLASLLSFKSLLTIGVIEFLMLAGLGVLDEAYYFDLPVSLSVFFVTVFAASIIYRKNSVFSRIGLGIAFVTVPVMLVAGFFWSGPVLIIETLVVAALSVLLLTGLGKIIQGRMEEPESGKALI